MNRDPGERDVELSNPDKVLYPADGRTKRDVFEYFGSVSSEMLPHVRGKPATLRRFPDGVHEEGFFQKAAPDSVPDWIRVAAVPQVGSAEPLHQVVADDAATLLYLANLACLELHVGLARVEQPDRPLLAVLDVDPPADVDLPLLRDVVRDLCRRFRGAGLTPYLQTTGGKGFHVVAPLAGEHGFDEVRDRMRTMSQQAQDDQPRTLTTSQRKQHRGDRIYLDVGRNAYGQTMIAPYSLRARDGAPAATPVTEEELDEVGPRSFGLAGMAERLARRGDPWSGIEQAHPAGLPGGA
ncbi:non-homologous end-joining DNA ligase [Saccharopolyspora sp. HNM0983]|uniref:Non-homologous end-joining DNA ligase n=1 Tax=Saccharopolyspora montiporae TaxID=2781240 RepID=A0A929G1E8_9PSEU|nr:non-homologous end-joining DNA ligase [Saccharopolyspora sp. HNM0983]MBE9376595.1 non-homologous end-joining DNA ligase [Saccharopolyspora sp. HNM0983]